MNSYIGKLVLIYFFITVAMLMALIPIYNTIESQQSSKIETILQPQCAYCELRDIYAKEGRDALKLHMFEKPQDKWLTTLIFKSNEMDKVSSSPWVQSEVMSAMALINENKIEVTVNVNPTAGKELILIYLDSDTYLLIEQYLSVSQQTPLNTIEEVKTQVNQALFQSLFITLFFTTLIFILTLYFSRKIYKKLNNINEISESIYATGDLSKRIPHTNGNSEFDRLAKQLNITFEAIENKVSDIRNISNTLAHELKTPLTRLTHQIEELNIPEEKHLLLKDSAYKANDIFNAILRISHLESGSARISRTTVNIENIVTDAVEFLAPMAEIKDQNVFVDIEAVNVQVDQSLTSQALINLLDNAIKYSPHSTTIQVHGMVQGNSLVISVQNATAKITADELRMLKQRFKRGSNTLNNEGLGLGLALVEAITIAHHGSLKLESGEFGFRAAISFVI